MKYVYHSSKTQGLKIIEPRVSTHGNSLVYAMEKPEYCLMFLGNHGDTINQTGFSNSLPYIAERFENALEYAYKGQEGSIYTLDRSDFKSGMTSFTEEFVCDHICDVIEEEKINNTLESVLQLELQGKVKIFRHFNLPAWIPKDKSDLVEKAVKWVPIHGDSVLKSIEKFHPEILEEIKQKLSK